MNKPRNRPGFRGFRVDICFVNAMCQEAAKKMPLAVEQKGKKTAEPKTNWVRRHAGTDVLNQPKFHT